MKGYCSSEGKRKISRWEEELRGLEFPWDRAVAWRGTAKGFQKLFGDFFWRNSERCVQNHGFLNPGNFASESWLLDFSVLNSEPWLLNPRILSHVSNILNPESWRLNLYTSTFLNPRSLLNHLNLTTFPDSENFWIQASSESQCLQNPWFVWILNPRTSESRYPFHIPPVPPNSCPVGFSFVGCPCRQPPILSRNFPRSMKSDTSSVHLPVYLPAVSSLRSSSSSTLITFCSTGTPGWTHVLVRAPSSSGRQTNTDGQCLCRVPSFWRYKKEKKLKGRLGGM